MQMLTYLARHRSAVPVSRRFIAAKLGLSSSYLAKIVNTLSRAGILRSYRGIAGGVMLGRAPAQITLLNIIEACQGAITAGNCGQAGSARPVCAYHRAMAEVAQALTETLSRWTILHLATENRRTSGSLNRRTCRMANVLKACA